MELPSKVPVKPTAENNPLIALRDQRVQEERMNVVQDDDTPHVGRMLTGPKIPMDPKKRASLLPAMEGIVWARAHKQFSHAFHKDSNSSMCLRILRSEAEFNRIGPNPCRECRMFVLRAQGRDVYLSGGKLCERTAEGTRKVARWNQ
jgi:hypothetical protein